MSNIFICCCILFSEKNFGGKNMKNNGNFKGGYIQLPVCDRTAVSETTADFTLPDYQPEIKRLLRVNASVLPPSKYIGDRECELAGNIDYYVLYTGSDNALYLAPLTGDYKIGVPMELPDGGDGGYLAEPWSSVTVSPDMISGRVTAPRKISIKCRLRARAQVFGEAPLDAGEIELTEDIQTLSGNAEVARISYGMSDQISVSDEMICDTREGDLRVIYGEGKVLLGEILPTAGAVLCRGDVYLKLMLCRDDGSQPYTVMRKIPLSGTVSVDGASSGDTATAKGTVTDMNITVDEGRIGIELGVVIEAEVCGDETVPYVKDVYSTERKTENTYKAVLIPKSATAFCGNFTLSGSLSLDETGIPVGASIIDVCGIAYPEEYIFDGDRCAIGGKARFSLLLNKDGEYSTADIELPFNYRTAASGEFDRAICAAEVISVRARADGDRVGVDAEIGISGRASLEKNEKMLSRVGFGEKLERSRGEFVVCYPSNEDSLWSVAKRYGAQLQKVADANGVSHDIAYDSAETLVGKNYLIV